MAQSSIEWTEATWNPVTGCTMISPGCAHCYAERMANRLKAMRNPNYKNGFELTLQPHMLTVPLRWKKPQMIFVNSMSDLFHRDVPVEYIQQVFAQGQLAHLPDSDEAVRPPPRTGPGSGLGAEHLDGGLGRERQIHVPH